MVEFKVVISDPKVKKAYQIEVKSPEADSFLGKNVGEKIAGEAINIPGGFEMEITGGSDKEGFPMRKDIIGSKRYKLLMAKGIGCRTTEKGKRLRKSIRGKQIAEDIVQINMKVVKWGAKKLGVALGKEQEEQPSEDKKEGEA